MAGIVLDASALLALLQNEPGADAVSAVIDGSIMSSVNWAEVVSVYAKLGASRERIEQHLGPLPIRTIDATRALAAMAGAMRPMTSAAGLSLGDRFCLALAAERELPAMTADRAWNSIAEAVGVEVVLIR